MDEPADSALLHQGRKQGAETVIHLQKTFERRGAHIGRAGAVDDGVGLELPAEGEQFRKSVDAGGGCNYLRSGDLFPDPFQGGGIPHGSENFFAPADKNSEYISSQKAC